MNSGGRVAGLEMGRAVLAQNQGSYEVAAMSASPSEIGP
jgi:hypothetical protein